MKIKELKKLGYNKLYERALECIDREWGCYIDDGNLTNAFDWEKTKEGRVFWSKLVYGKIQEAFEMFPEYREEWEPKEGEMIMVRDSDNEEWRERKFIAKAKEIFIAWCRHEKEPVNWKQAKPIEEPKDETKYLWKVKDRDGDWYLNECYMSEVEADKNLTEFKDYKKITLLEELLTIKPE
jgi:hypothetical protein